MLLEHALEDFLDLLYAAPSHPDLWSDVLSGLVEIVGADSGWMARLFDSGSGGDGHTCRLDPSAQTEYFTHFERLDPFRDRRSQPLGLFGDGAYLSKASLTRSEFYNDFMRPLDAHSILKLRLFHDGRSSSVVHLNRSRKRGAFDRQSTATATRLFPHLARATRLHAVLRDAELTARCGKDLVASSHRPTMLLDTSGRVYATNAAADALLDLGNVFTRKNGVLLGTSAVVVGKLEHLLAGADAIEKRPRPNKTIFIDRGHERLPLIITVAPFGNRSAGRLFGTGPTLILTIGDPEGLRRPHLSLLADMFRLTTAEGVVALHLMDGMSIKGIAAKAAISQSTVRNHVKTIFAKTGVCRQGELVALLMRIASAL